MGRTALSFNDVVDAAKRLVGPLSDALAMAEGFGQLKARLALATEGPFPAGARMNPPV